MQSRSQVPAAELVMPTHHRITSFDGESLSALLFRPRQPHSTPTPVVVFMHGGPESQTQVAWNPIIQYLVGHGYAVVAPNVRGSSGYGKRFYSLDDRRLRLDSVRDMGAVHDWLASQELDPKRAALYGGSYGGYMVLAGLSMQPEKWAAGVDVVGIASLVTFLENTSAYRRRRREHEYGYLDSDRDFLIEASPMTHIDKIRAPLMIIHGRNDPRVPVGEAEQIHAALRARGIKSELMIFEDEGHGLAKLANRLRAYPKVAAFLDRVFGQRDLGLSA